MGNGEFNFIEMIKRIWRVLTQCRKDQHDIIFLNIAEEDRDRWSGDLDPWCADCGRSFPEEEIPNG